MSLDLDSPARPREASLSAPFGDLPFALQVEITSHCNLKCRMCPLTWDQTLSSGFAGHMEEATWERVMELAAQTHHVILSGFGEPFMHPKCLEFLHQLDAAGVTVSMATNGTGLTERVVAEALKLPRVAHINVSIDSPDPEIYRAVRGGDLAKALKGLRILMAAVENPYLVTVSSVVMAENAASLEAFPPLLAELGVRHYVLQGLIDYRLGEGHPKDQAPEGPPGDNALERIRTACEKAGVELHFTQPDRMDPVREDPSHSAERYRVPEVWSDEETRQCMLPWEMPYVDREGRVFPCCFVATEPTGVLGNLREQTFSEVWRGSAFERFRADILEGATTPEVCRRCNAVPLGEHPLRHFGARVLELESVLAGTRDVDVAVQNTGETTWLPSDRIFVGTTRPRDRHSSLALPSWPGPNRATMLDEEVPPGGAAHFRFHVAAGPGVEPEWFQLVVDGRFWVPGTYFEVRPPAPVADGLRGRCLRACRRTVERSWRLLRPLLPAAARAWVRDVYKARIARFLE